MSTRCVVLSGGVGGAKLALGLSRIVADSNLAVIVNTGDDFDHLGLRICPDLDTVLYTLADCVNTETGWGRRDESWQCMAALADLGGETWFRLGDRDLATHFFRTDRLQRGMRLTEVTAELCAALSVRARLLPATDDSLATCVQTPEGVLAFQDYFVRRQAEPRVQSIEFRGGEHARATPEVLDALHSKDLDAVIIAPSNPYLSIDPLLAIPDLDRALRETPAPVVAVSPIVGGRALKGPTAKIMAELGLSASAVSVADHYRPWLDGFVLDQLDAPHQKEIEAMGIPVLACDTIMRSLDDRTALAQASLDFARRCRGQKNERS